MTDITERLAEIEARVEGATEGPWRFDPEGESHCGEPQCCSEYWDNRIWGADRVLAESHMLSEADAEFIAHARTDIPWLVEQVRELQAECLRVDEANTRLGERVRELEAENESLRTALRRKENHRARAREQVRQRDEVIERVRKLADEWERTYPSLMVGPFLRAVLEGDGEVKEENDE